MSVKETQQGFCATASTTRPDLSTPVHDPQQTPSSSSYLGRMASTIETSVSQLCSLFSQVILHKKDPKRAILQIASQLSEGSPRERLRRGSHSGLEGSLRVSSTSLTPRGFPSSTEPLEAPSRIQKSHSETDIFKEQLRAGASTSSPQSIPRSASAMDIKSQHEDLLSHFVYGPKELVREVLIKHLLGEEIGLIKPLNPLIQLNSLSAKQPAQGLRSVLSSFISERHMYPFPTDLSEEAAQEWLDRSLEGIRQAKEHISRKDFHGTLDVFVNALVGPILLNLSEPGFSQEAALKKPETEDDIRLERWKNVGEKIFQRRNPESTQTGIVPGLIGEKKPPIVLANMIINTSLAHADGARPVFEDEVTFGKITFPEEEIGFFSIFDGHGGVRVSAFLRENLEQLLRSHLEFVKRPLKSFDRAEMENILAAVFVRAQRDWISQYHEWSRNLFIVELKNVLKNVLFETANDLVQTELKKEKLASSSSACEKPNELNKFFHLSSIWIQKNLDSKTIINSAFNEDEQSEIFITNLFGAIKEFEESNKTQTFQTITFGKELTKEEIVGISQFLWSSYRKLQANKKRCMCDPGATASLALLINDKEGPALWTVNVGDARIIAIQKEKVYQLTEDAHPTRTGRFFKGIIKRGGHIAHHGSDTRVMGEQISGNMISINVARAVGDVTIQGITARAKIQRFALLESTVLIIGCDGLYETSSSHSVGSACAQFIEKREPNPAESLVKKAYQEGSLDNLSALVAHIQIGTPQAAAGTSAQGAPDDSEKSSRSFSFS